MEDKAKQRAMEAYPPKFTKQKRYSKRVQYEKIDVHQSVRTIYIKGYHQAEKDLELSWEDINIILNIENDILRECNSQKELVIETYPKGEDYYGEILKRFKDFKERKEQ